MGIAFFGNGTRGVRCLETLLQNEYTISAVIGHVGDSDVVTCAKKLGINTFQPTQVNDPDFLREIHKLSAELFVLAGYNNILKKEIISFPKKGAINLHGGKLPDYRGVAPINWQIIKGEKVGGCCIIFVDEGIDTGDIIDQEFYDIGENDTAGDVVQRQLEIFPPMLLKAVQNIEKGTVNAAKQHLGDGAYYTRRYPDDGRVNFTSMTALDAHNMIRAMRGPYPPAFCFYNDKKIYLLGSKLLKEEIIGTSGRIVLKRPEGVIVLARDRGLLITEVSSSMEGPAQKVGDKLKTGNNLE